MKNCSNPLTTEILKFIRTFSFKTSNEEESSTCRELLAQKYQGDHISLARTNLKSNFPSKNSNLDKGLIHKILFNLGIKLIQEVSLLYF
jgi:hypothetical protein